MVAPSWRAGSRGSCGGPVLNLEESLRAFLLDTCTLVFVSKTCQFPNISISIFLLGPFWLLNVSPAPPKTSWDPGFHGFIGKCPGVPAICQGPLPCFLCYGECHLLDQGTLDVPKSLGQCVY